MTERADGSNVILFPTPDRFAVPARIELRSHALRGLSNLHFADHLVDRLHCTEEELLAVARRAINKAYRHRADGLAYPHSEKTHWPSVACAACSA